MPMTMSIQNESVTYRAEVLIVAVANNSVSICLLKIQLEKQAMEKRSGSSYYWFWLLLQILLINVLGLHCQPPPDSTSFISIDCGISDGTSYVDSTTGLTYVSDNAYIDSGKDYNIDSTYLSSFRQELTTLRSFPDSTRSCYTLRPVVQYYKYLVRAYFLYGNYDGLHRANTLKPLEFDVYIDVNMLMTMSIQNESITYRAKALIVAVANNSVSICLVNTGNGVPFISSLELRPMDSSLYTLVNNNFYLQVYARLNLGATQTIRYPTDPYDRIWREWTRSDWTNINTTQPIQYFSYDDYRVPEAVMQTAVIPSGVGGVTDIEFYWDFADTGFRNNRFYATLFFSEFDALLPNQSRAVDIFLNGYNCFADYPPSYLWADVIYSDGPLYQNYTYRWEIKPNDSFNLPPILNAVEVFSAMYLENVTANERDGTLSATYFRFSCGKFEVAILFL
ncbi:probable LRR receptor-like serine/threonine-protein kinase At1g51810 [Zingiber officinale]|uniref:probable LRR receptor-like serine/threonine-protein kinase At1g51810 n=1 Tax=Zingiber officinale TaxID=94328 RepID=UPI001C4CF494|nr:probable LRR receptor-like serine/threonine-protein kinase At1g51810 [Zingiber officinale]